MYIVLHWAPDPEPVPSVFRLTLIGTGNDTNRRAVKSQLSGIAAAVDASAGSSSSARTLN
jgi:hypothetical protein